MGRHSNTQVWEYFDYISDKLAECQTCKARITTPQRGTYNLKRHLLTMHSINTYLKGTCKDKISNKSNNFSNCWKFKRMAIRLADGGTDNIYNDDLSVTGKDEENICSNGMSEDDNNHSITMEEDDENHSVVTLDSSIKESLPENKIYKLDPEDNCNGVKKFQNDPLSKTNMAISSVYSTTNPVRDSSPIPTATIEKSSACIELEKLKTEALVAKYRAEARYFNELADLAHSKRLYVDLQCQQLRKEFKKSKYS